MFRGEEHGRAVMRAEEAHSFFRNLRKLQKGNHLKTDIGVSYNGFGYEVRRVTDPPLSVSILCGHD